MTAMVRRLMAVVVLCSLVACGGGGGAGSTPFGGTGTGGTGTGTGAGTDTGTGTTATTYVMAVEVQRAGASATQITSTETVQAVATVTTQAGGPVQGVVVTFTETSASLLAFAPTSATALTNASGKASLDIAAKASTGTGATTVNAAATVATTAITAAKSIQITAGAVNPGVVPTPAAINFVSSSAGSTAIVIKGAGGTGRSESAILTFKVVDSSNAPINGATVNFTLNADIANSGGSSGATLLQTSAVSNSEGLVNVTVASGSLPASIVVRASAANTNPAVVAQSDTLLVSTGVAVVGGFEIVASKYNLDGRLSGDSAIITARVRDSNGNPVADGVAVSFQTDFGVVATSAAGGCLTLNGSCTVDYRVQDPRGTGIATVVASVRVAQGTVLTQSLRLNLASAAATSYLALLGNSPVTQLTMSSCKQVFELVLSDGAGRAPAAGTIISSPVASSDFGVTVGAGSPVADQLSSGFPPVGFAVQVDLTSTDLRPLCSAGGANTATGFLRLQFQTPGGIVFQQRIDVIYRTP